MSEEIKNELEDMDNEVWKKLFLDGKETKYQVSNKGRVKNDKIILSQCLKNEYYFVKLSKKNYRVHRLVAMCFIENPENKPTVDHIDRNKLNNNLSNLKWATQSEQCLNRSQINNNRRSRSVWRLDKETCQKLQNYKSFVEAGKWVIKNKYTESIKLVKKYISKAVCNKQEFFGFKWVYDEEIKEEEIKEEEIWKEIPHIFINNKGIFASNFGRIKISNGKISNSCNKENKTRDYLTVSIFRKSYAVHRLIAQTFLENPEKKEIVNHKNGIKHDNRLENLEFVTQSENLRHAVSIGLIKSKKIVQYSLTGVKINSFVSITEASRQTNIDRVTIGKCCTGKKKSSGGYFWKYDDGKEVKIPMKKISNINKPVIQYSIEGDKIEEFDTIKIASEKTNINLNSITSCCTGYKNQKTAGGFIWKFRDN